MTVVRIWFFRISNRLCIKQHSEGWRGGEKALKPQKKNWFTQRAKLVNGRLKYFKKKQRKIS